MGADADAVVASGGLGLKPNSSTRAQGEEEAVLPISWVPQLSPLYSTTPFGFDIYRGVVGQPIIVVVRISGG